MLDLFPKKKFMLKVNNRNSRKKCKIFLRFTIKTPATLLKKRLRHRCFSVKCFKNTIFYRTLSVGAFFTYERMLLSVFISTFKGKFKDSNKRNKTRCKISKGEDTLWNISFRYFMEHSLMYKSLHLIWFHETHIKYVKRKAPRNVIGTIKCSVCYW